MIIRPLTRNLLTWCIAALLIFLMHSCAIQSGPPKGGPKDVTPPKVKAMIPPNKTTHFDAKKIEIQFDEFVELDNPTSEIIISPVLDKNPEISSNKKSVYINFKNVTLKPNTTYSIYSGRAIKDIHEGNVLDNLHYVFSTGEYIDSLKISGSVIDALTLKPLAGAHMMLYATGTDSNLFKGKPLYFAKGDSSGKFTIENLAKGRYSLYALDDKNQSYRLDDGELVGFVNNIIQVDSNVRIVGPIRVSAYHSSRSDIKRARLLSERVSVKFDQPVDTFGVKLLNGAAASRIYEKLAESRDSLVAWPLAKYDSLSLHIFANGMPVDTILKRNTESKEKPVRFIVESTSSGENVNQYGYFMLTSATKPIAAINENGITIKSDSVKIPLRGIHFLDSSRTYVAIDFATEEGKTYKVTFAPGAFTSVFGEKNKDTIHYQATPPGGDVYGNLELTLIPDSMGSFNFQLVNSDGKIYFSKEFSRETLVKIPYIQAGEYKMRIIRDVNSNGRWDAVSVDKRKQPEEVVYYPDPIKIKANWEVGDVIFDMKKAKSGSVKQ